MTLKKSDLIKILVEEYGYEKEDLKFDVEGKPYTNAKLQALINAEKEDAEVLASTSARVSVKKNKKIQDTDLIPVMNGLTGGLYYKSERTHRVWEFKGFGQHDTMEYAELVALKNRYPSYFYDCWLIVLDKEVQEEFRLTGLYENILTPENINELFDKPIEEIKMVVEALPQSMQVTFVDTAKEKYNDGTLDSMKVIKYIEERFKFSLDDLAPINDIADTANTVQMGNKRAIIVESR